MPSIEILAKRASLTHTVHDFTRVRLALDGLKWRPSDALGLLDDDTIGILHHWGNADAVQDAKQKVSAALQSIAVMRRFDAQAAPVAAPPRAAVEFPTELWNVDASDQAAELDRWSTKFARRAVPVGIWATFVAAGRLKREALEAKVDALEKRLAAFETAPRSLDYQGIWQRAVAYRRNEAVTHRSSLWMCLADGRGVEPGTAPAYWQLAQKEDDR